MPKRRANGEGSIYKRKNGTWAAQFTDYSGKQRYFYGRTQKEVKDKLKEAIRLNDDGLSMNAGRITYGQWLEEWLETYVRPTVRTTTYTTYYAQIHNHLIPAFNNVKLKDLREPVLQRFINEKTRERLDGKKGGYSVGILVHLRSHMKASLEKAVRLGMIPRNPAAYLTLPKPERTEKQILTPEQQERFEAAAIQAMERDYTAGMFVIMLRTGLRIGEALALRLEDIDLEKGVLYVRQALYFIKEKGEEGQGAMTFSPPKTSTSIREIPLSSSLSAFIRFLLDMRKYHIDIMREGWEQTKRFSPEWLEAGLLFVSFAGNALCLRTARDRMERIIQAASVPQVSPHALRHTFATRWLEAGLDIKSLSEILGHANAKMTLNVYAHSLPQQKRDSVEKLDGTFLGKLL